MSPGRALPKERAAQQARALECIYEAEATASGTGTSLAVLASRLGTSDHDANETLIGLVHRGEIIHDPASGEYRLTDSGRLEAARRFTLIPGSPPADAHKKTPREADDMTRLPSNEPDDQKTLVGGRPQTSDDDQQTIVGAPPGAATATTARRSSAVVQSRAKATPVRSGLASDLGIGIASRSCLAWAAWAPSTKRGTASSVSPLR